MRKVFKRCQLPMLATLAVVTILGTTSEAFAAAQKGESSKYTLEMVGGSGLATRNDEVEARTEDGNRLNVWRGANNTVWMSLNGGTPFQTVQATATNVAPAVVPWGGSDFMVFHTGTDGNIYYITVFSEALDESGNHTSGEWSHVPAQTTSLPVSVAPMHPGDVELFMVYHGFAGDNRIWGTWFDGFGHWSQADNIGGGLGIGPPSIALIPEIPESQENPIPFADRLIVTVDGADNNIWTTGQVVGAQNWNPWMPILGQGSGANAGRNLAGGVAVEPGRQVNVAVNENTDGSQTIVLAALDENFHPEFATFNTGMVQLSDWGVDITNFSTGETPSLSTNEHSTFSLLTGLDGFAYWKQEFQK